jgi:hypothetical protein
MKHYRKQTLTLLTAIVVILCFVSCNLSNIPPGNNLDQDIYLLDGTPVSGPEEIKFKTLVQRIVSNIRPDKYYPEIEIINPLNESVFPIDMASTDFVWNDPYLKSNMWLVIIRFKSNKNAIYLLTNKIEWRPGKKIWGIIKKNSIKSSAMITILGINAKRSFEVITKNSVAISTSKDPVGASVFYQHMPLPFARAKKHPELSKWYLGDVSSYEDPPVIMEKLPMCGNCHSFSSDGKIFGMDMDYRKDKGAYVLTPVREQINIKANDFITWNDFQKSEKLKSMGLFSRISPDGKYVVSTVKETSFFAMIPDLEFSQFFFPIRGLVACYSREEKRFFSLPGADNPNYVQTCPVWSPDGKYIVFSRARVNRRLTEIIGDKGYIHIEPDIRIDDLNKQYKIHFNLYRISFSGGKGGEPELIKGASHNGKSNYFPKYSPDGRWIVFTQSETGLAIQPDSRLCIIPAEGGTARVLKCNRKIMNSWHSWSMNSRWLVFASKANTPFTELFLTHIDKYGNSSVPVLLSRFSSKSFAAIVPEFVDMKKNGIKTITINYLGNTDTSN